MFTVSCGKDCIKVHCVKFCTTVIPSFFVNAISHIEVGLELECQLKPFCFPLIVWLIVFKRQFKLSEKVLHLLQFFSGHFGKGY